MKIQIEDADLRKLLDENESLKREKKELFNRNLKLRRENSCLQCLLNERDNTEEKEEKKIGWYFYES